MTAAAKGALLQKASRAGYNWVRSPLSLLPFLNIEDVLDLLSRYLSMYLCVCWLSNHVTVCSPVLLHGYLPDCVTDCLACCLCLTVWLSDSRTAWLSDCLISWLFEPLIVWLETKWLSGCMNAWPSDCLMAWLCDGWAVWLSNCLTACLHDCLTVCLPDCLTAWMPDCLTAWLSDCRTTGLSDCLTVWLPDCLTVWPSNRLTFRFSDPRPGKCPRLLPPEFCISHYDECENDEDCYPGKKCCSNDCFSRCVNPSFEEIGGKLRSKISHCELLIVHRSY